MATFYSEHDPTANNGFSIPIGDVQNIRCEVGPYTAQAGDKAVVSTSGYCAMPTSSHYFKLATVRSIDGGAYQNASLYPYVLSGAGGSGSITSFGNGTRSMVIPLSAGSVYKFASDMRVYGTGTSTNPCTCTTVVQIVK